jgi:hypothetical protein
VSHDDHGDGKCLSVRAIYSAGVEHAGPFRGSRQERKSALTRPAGALLLFLLLAPATSYADAVGYAKVADVRVEGKSIVAVHRHDWTRATEKARFTMITTTRNPFTKENTYSYLRVTDRTSGRELFRAPVPALTHLWISPDSRFIVGMSHIKLWNPYQLVVFDRSGNRLLARSINASSWPGVQESVTNFVNWYKWPAPSIAIRKAGDAMVLSIEDRLGTQREFRFEAK